MPVEGGSFGVEAAGEPCGGNFQCGLANPLWGGGFDEGVVVGQEVGAIDVWELTGGDGRSHGPDVVAEVRGAGCGDPGEHTGDWRRGCRGCHGCSLGKTPHSLRWFDEECKRTLGCA